MAEQIAFRREMRANFGNRAPEEICRGFRELFPRLRRLRLRLRRPRRTPETGSRDVGIKRQRQAADFLPAGRGRPRGHAKGIHHRSRSGWRRLRWRLRLRPGRSSDPPDCSVPSCADISRRKSWRRGWPSWAANTTMHWLRSSATIMDTPCIAHLTMTLAIRTYILAEGRPDG